MMSKDMSDIRALVNIYFEAVKERKYEKFLESWHSESKMSFIREEEVLNCRSNTVKLRHPSSLSCVPNDDHNWERLHHLAGAV